LIHSLIPKLKTTSLQQQLNRKPITQAKAKTKTNTTQKNQQKKVDTISLLYCYATVSYSQQSNH